MAHRQLMTDPASGPATNVRSSGHLLAESPVCKVTQPAPWTPSSMSGVQYAESFRVIDARMLAGVVLYG